jgi:hypothetical protein
MPSFPPVEVMHFLVDSMILIVSFAELYFFLYMNESLEDIEEDIEDMNGREKEEEDGPVA